MERKILKTIKYIWYVLILILLFVLIFFGYRLQEAFVWVQGEVR